MPKVQRTLRVRLVRVIDGDSVQVRPAGLFIWLLGALMDGSVECRLYGIDAPELGQELGSRARDELARLMGRGAIWMDVIAVDRYGRTVARFYRDPRDPSDSINHQMALRGWAYWYRQWARTDFKLRDAEEYARLTRRGVWAQPDGGQRPWDWRKQNRESVLSRTRRRLSGLWKLLAAAAFLAVMGLDAAFLDGLIAGTISSGVRWLIGLLI